MGGVEDGAFGERHRVLPKDIRLRPSGAGIRGVGEIVVGGVGVGRVDVRTVGNSPGMVAVLTLRTVNLVGRERRPVIHRLGYRYVRPRPRTVCQEAHVYGSGGRVHGHHTVHLTRVVHSVDGLSHHVLRAEGLPPVAGDLDVDPVRVAGAGIAGCVARVMG